MSIFGTLLATLIYDSVVWHVVKDGKRRNRLEARLPRQARTPIFPNYDDAQYNDNRNGAEMAGQITCRIITGEFYEFLWRRFFLLVVLLFLMKRAGRRDASATVGGIYFTCCICCRWVAYCPRHEHDPRTIPPQS